MYNETLVVPDGGNSAISHRRHTKLVSLATSFGVTSLLRISQKLNQ
jgi:hypothetical protein